jgi:large subunit ribosomal protein L4e
MFAPTRLERRWHRKINTNQRRFAVCSALAASAVPSLVMARGHRISGVPEIPLVIADEAFEGIAKTKEAMKLIQKFKISEEIDQVRSSRRIRAGKGKARNRRHISKRGPLVIHSGNNRGLVLAFRNIPGIKLSNVFRLNLLQLAPGGHIGRFIIWTESAFNLLNKVFGSFSRSSTIKRSYRPPRPILYNPDITRIINSEEIKSVVKRRKIFSNRLPRKRNPLRNINALAKLNPYAAGVKKHTLAKNAQIQLNRDLNKERKKTQKPGEKKPKKDKSKITPASLAKKKALFKRQNQRAKSVRKATEQWRKILHTPAIAPAKSEFEGGEV